MALHSSVNLDIWNIEISARVTSSHSLTSSKYLVYLLRNVAKASFPVGNRDGSVFPQLYLLPNVVCNVNHDVDSLLKITTCRFVQICFSEKPKDHIVQVFVGIDRSGNGFEVVGIQQLSTEWPIWNKCDMTPKGSVSSFGDSAIPI